MGFGDLRILKLCNYHPDLVNLELTITSCHLLSRTIHVSRTGRGGLYALADPQTSQFRVFLLPTDLVCQDWGVDAVLPSRKV